MTDLDLLHFEQLKKDVQAQYLKEYTPSYDEISKWKGIDIIYFQEDLRKKAKGNISEKSFYTYFKSSPVSKLPRIDMLNLLSIYAGYASWYDFKKNHLFAGELLSEEKDLSDNELKELEKTISSALNLPKIEDETKKSEFNGKENIDLQKNNTENQVIEKKQIISEPSQITEVKPLKKNYQRTAWIAAASVFVILLGLLGFKDEIFQKTYVYCFTDADRNLNVQRDIEIKVIKENESPILYRIKPGECFRYPTKDKTLKMQISSTVYEDLEVNRNLENAPEEETIELKPDDYKMALYYFSIKDINGENSEQLIKQKRKQLENLISNTATITQVYDSDIYGLETLDKQDYITLVTTPTTSLKNLNVIEMKKDKGKIVSIKFKISNHENNK
ncbi:hypothetical protein NAL32_01720 [Chryseobacterium sp. Ch-15]|uniref:Uncharacterized protein n=1 Tax=Chryseobacterium muglaense TaxID=2893752 RepID=A0A9Q3YRI0_9FLAO|nr:hypothetical protein [Chryseobacterium muglaense]MBD3903764.1 hypothetical protein [Chryseobacterium muglaense]MCC9034839.1 hypothetical protein [Chryseobacterium muglaense]MCM2553104.1 hypothetical protein [Chryseobacterium muglaense]